MKQKTDATMPGFVGGTKRFKPYGDPIKRALYDDGNFIVVEGEWKEGDNSESEEAIACRWYGFNPELPLDQQGKGYPNGFGRAQWMILPEYLGLLVLKDHVNREMDLARPELAS